jgi:glycosyltransferase involved in cell wall biosynthesis
MTPKPAEIAILMAAYNGEKYLKWQLKSILEQSYPHWKIAISDDGSSDSTLDILREFQKHCGDDRASLFSGPKKGFCSNFLSLLYRENITADYYAFSDQDDIWETDKLERAIDYFKKIPSNIPALYCGRTTLFNDAGEILGVTALFKKKPSFRNALVQSISGANSMVFNQAACELLRKVSVDIDVQSHDWWVYLVITGCGGSIFYDTHPTLRYRQHNENLVGMNNTITAKLFRIHQLFKGRFKGWNERNLVALLSMYDYLTPENKTVLDQFIVAKNAHLFQRMRAFLKSGVYRQTFFQNIGLMAAALLKKI